jgi:hypothetical protein
MTGVEATGVGDGSLLVESVGENTIVVSASVFALAPDNSAAVPLVVGRRSFGKTA